MGSRFGFRSGDVHAKNLAAGTFILSGTGGTLVQKAITFNNNHIFHNAPRIQITQLLGSNGSSKYDVFWKSGVPGVSGVTTAGFTAVLDFNTTMTEDAGDASGVQYSYIAYDHLTRYD